MTVTIALTAKFDREDGPESIVSVPFSWRRATLAGAAFLGGLMSVVPAQAGLLEFLFGDAFREQPRYAPRHEPLDVRVNPRRKANGAAKNLPEHEKKRALAVSIDPVKHPNWYLEDPTLRRGDIVVLKGQVLVYDGARGPVTRAAFTALDKSPLISKSERTRIGKMADTSGAPLVEPAQKPTAEFEAPKAAANKEAALQRP